ncbi:MAG: serine protein kinase RIO [Candidatus Micrarchaeota archaeon]|nr:serine protein kinase RIO [Candidatus Micrarchaeota archaeon]
MGRKKPLKEDFQLKERMKIESEVFDKNTLLSLFKLMKKGIIGSVENPISTGKEANVFRGKTPDGAFVAIKIYKIETTHFFRRKTYLQGDPRFEKIKNNEKEIVKAFARKEFKNLEICERSGVNSPKAFYVLDNIIVMEFMGEEGLPYPTMELVGPLNGKADLDSILDDMRRMYKEGLVHADLSEYNILAAEKPIIIDLSEGVVLGHPHSEIFLERDVTNILKYFAKKGIKKDMKKVLEQIRK